MPKQKVLLIIMDGWGINHDYPGNAITQANLPTFNHLWATAPHATLAASGEAVGLPEGQMGTSEANHLIIGAGRVLFQDLVKINRALRNDEFKTNPAFVAAFDHVKKNNSVLHIQGLVSDGGVHSHQDHIKALVKAAKESGVERIFIHVITDGRDTLPKSALNYVSDMQQFLKEIGVGKIVSISGRYYAMDRDHNWERTDKAFEVYQGKKDGHPVFQTVEEAINAAYDQNTTDEFIEPAFIEVDDSGEIGAVSTNDAVIFANFRSDRARQLTERWMDVRDEKNLEVVTMSEYNPEYTVKTGFPSDQLTNLLGEVIAQHGLKQLRITETDKFVHMTYFMNGKKEMAFEGEDRFGLDSYSDIKTHDERPGMRALDIAKQIVEEMENENYDFIGTNIVNADIVGHTSNIPATIEAVETIDKALSLIIPVAQQHDYAVLITADHGNAEQMIDEESGEALTAHTLNPVPFIVVSNQVKELKRTEAGLSDIAPTVLKLLDLPIPEEMTGESLV